MINWFKNHKTEVGALLLFLFLFITNAVPIVFSDGYCYFHTAKSLVSYGSFVSPEKPEYYDYRGHVIEEYKGNYVNVCSPGAALVNYPGIAIANIIEPQATIYNNYFKAYYGHSFSEGMAFLITASLAATATLVLLYQSLRELKYDSRVSKFVTAVTYSSSYAIWYVLLQPSYTHSYEMLFLSLLIWSFIKFTQNQKLQFAAIMGVSLGSILLIRPVSIIPAGFFVLYLCAKKQFRAMFILGLSLLPLLVIWSIYNYVSYGVIFGSGYDLIRGETFDFSSFHFFDVLFSAQRGWFIYSPTYLLAFIGFVLLWKRSKFWAVAGTGSSLLLALIYGFWPSWWGGGSYGSRFMLAAVPLTIVGSAYLIKFSQHKKVNLGKIQLNVQKCVLILFTITTLWSVLLTILYRFTPVPDLRPKSDSVGIMLSGDRYTPLDIIKYHIQLVNDSTSIKDYLLGLKDSFHGGNNIPVYFLGIADVVLRIDERQENTLKFLLLDPPAMNQPHPPGINIIQYYPQTKKANLISISNLEGNEISIICNANCQSTTTEVTITPLPDYPLQLKKEDYIGINPDNYEFELYFEKLDNLQIKGPPILTEINTDVYKLD